MGGENSTKAQDALLAFIMLAGEMTGAVLCMATILLQRGLLPRWLETMYELSGNILWLGLMPVYFCLRAPGKEKGRQKVKGHWQAILKWELWIFTVLCAWRLADRAWLALWRKFFLSEALYGAVFFLLIFVAVFVASFLIHKMLGCCGLRRRVLGIQGAVLTACALYASLAALAALSRLWGWLSQLASASVVSMLGGHVFMAGCAYGVFWLFMRTVCADRESGGVQPEGDGQETCQAETGTAEGGASGFGIARAGKVLGAGIPLVLSAVLLFFTEGKTSFSSAAEQAAFAVEECMEKGYADIEAGNSPGAGRWFALAEARAKALECLTGEEPDTRALESVYKENPQDLFIGTLYVSNRRAVALLEKNVRSCLWDRDWYPVLLRLYAELEEEKALSETQEELRQEMLFRCIAAEDYGEGTGLFAADLEGDALVLQKRLGDFEEELALCGLFGLAEQYGAEGGYTEELAYQSLEMAEENPYNLLLQYMACQIAGNYQTDNARHYERTIEAARRFDRLYDDGSRTDQELAAARRFLGNVAARCYDYETAHLYLRDVWELSGDTAAALSCARLYERSGDYGQCLELAQDVTGEEPDNTQALYLAAISALKTGDLDTALGAAGRLGDLVADKDRPLNVAEENNLYVCAQYLAMEDSGRWTDYTWQAYGSLTEEQADLARSHELLWHYMTAIHECFMKREYEAAEETVEKALALREDLAMGWYLRGTIALNKEEFEEARRYFEKSLECGGVSPSIYFSLANVYDAMEDYENAWLYARKVEEMLPYQDHGNDVYGISVHNGRLLEEIGKKLGR